MRAKLYTNKVAKLTECLLTLNASLANIHFYTLLQYLTAFLTQRTPLLGIFNLQNGDMKKNNLVLLLWLLTIHIAFAQSHAPIPHLASGTLCRFANFTSQYVDARNIDVWLPAKYNAKKTYSVLYMHDGQSLFDSAVTWNKQEWGVDETMGRLLQSKQIQPCIVVGIWNSGSKRHMDYFPQKPFESIPKAIQDTLLQCQRSSGSAVFLGKPQSDAYLKFLVYELKPFIDSVFKTRTQPEYTFIAGSSMGGLISMYALCEYPNVFGGAACLSTHWPGIFTNHQNPIPNAFLNYLQQHLPKPASKHKLYFDYGTTTLDALYPEHQQKVDSLVQAAGYPPEQWITLRFEGENHSEKAWQKRLTTPLLFLLGNQSKPTATR